MLKYLFNGIYEDNVDIQAIIDAVQPEIDDINARVEAFFRDAFPLTATITGIVMWENIMGIVPDLLTENLEFRRDRVLSRLISDIPYTERALTAVMNNIMGAGNWSYTLDYNNYILIVNALRHGKNWVNEMDLTLGKMIPANMIYYLYILYNTHSALADYTHAHLGTFTHQVIREEELA